LCRGLRCFASGDFARCCNIPGAAVTSADVVIGTSLTAEVSLTTGVAVSTTAEVAVSVAVLATVGAGLSIGGVALFLGEVPLITAFKS
jgi:hypothetical protein